MTDFPVVQPNSRKFSRAASKFGCPISMFSLIKTEWLRLREGHGLDDKVSPQVLRDKMERPHELAHRCTVATGTSSIPAAFR